MVDSCLSLLQRECAWWQYQHLRAQAEGRGSPWHPHGGRDSAIKPQGSLWRHQSLLLCWESRYVLVAVQCVPQKWPNLFLSELYQISTIFDNFRHTDSQDNTNTQGTLIIHLTWFMSMHYHVKCRCFKLLHYMVIISIRLLIFLLSVWHRVPSDVIILWYWIFYAENGRQLNNWLMSLKQLLSDVASHLRHRVHFGSKFLHKLIILLSKSYFSLCA